MDSLQKKEVEVSCKLKKEMQVPQGCSSPLYKITDERRGPCCMKSSNIFEHQCICKRSNGMLKELRSPKEGCVKALLPLNFQQLTLLSPFNAKLDKDTFLNPFKDRFYALRPTLPEASISDISGGNLEQKDVKLVNLRLESNIARESKISTARKDAPTDTMTMLKKVTTTAEDRCLSCKQEVMPSFFESLYKEELSLSNLTVSEPLSLVNISGKSSLLDILNYFPSRAPVVSSRKKLLILDINGILADIVYPPPKGYKADTKIAGRAVFARPFCSDFLDFCLERFNVAIWSSRSRKIIDRLLNYLMGDMKHKLVFCWDLSHCTDSKFRTLENKHKALVFKELRKVWDSYDSDLPWEKGLFDESNTLLLDDTPYKALLNPPHTSIFPYSYEYKDAADDALGPGGNIRAYLEELAAANNVQKYIEKHPFGQSAINERSFSWQFYDKVIKEQSAVPARG